MTNADFQRSFEAVLPEPPFADLVERFNRARRAGLTPCGAMHCVNEMIATPIGYRTFRERLRREK